MGYPKRFHVASEGCFEGEAFLKFCSDKAIEISMCTGETHWQNGVAERHVGVLRTVLDKLLLEEEIQQIEGPMSFASEEDHFEKLISECCNHKNTFGRYGGSSPSQWMAGRRHPILESDELPPMTEGNVNSLEEHLNRRSVVADLFHRADAKATITPSLADQKSCGHTAKGWNVGLLLPTRQRIKASAVEQKLPRICSSHRS